MGEAVGGLASTVRNRIDEAVVRDADHLAETCGSLVGLGLEVQNVFHLREAHVQPFDHFGADVPQE